MKANIMKTEQFAKIINLENHQVVVMKDFDNDADEVDILWVVTTIDGVLIQIRAGFKETKIRDKAFKEYNKTAAQKFVNGALSMMEE